MSEPHLDQPRSPAVRLLRGGAAAAAVAAGLPLASRAAARPRPAGIASAGIANVRVSHDQLRGPCRAVGGGQPSQPSPAPRRLPGRAHGEPQCHRDLPLVGRRRKLAQRRPAAASGGKPPAGDDVTVAFDPRGRGYVCATATGSTDADRTMYVWRTDDGGRSFSAPVTWSPGRDSTSISPGSPPAPGRPRRSATSTWSGPQRS